MYLGNDLVEAVPIHREDLQQPGYLGKFKRYLKEKYQELLMQTGDSPEFLIETDPITIPEKKNPK
jgi:hypothetical protein